jgi:hypothetical protein
MLLMIPLLMRAKSIIFDFSPPFSFSFLISFPLDIGIVI